MSQKATINETYNTTLGNVLLKNLPAIIIFLNKTCFPCTDVFDEKFFEQLSKSGYNIFYYPSLVPNEKFWNLETKYFKNSLNYKNYNLMVDKTGNILKALDKKSGIPRLLIVSENSMLSTITPNELHDYKRSNVLFSKLIGLKKDK